MGTVKDPAVDFAAIVAFDREKMCDVWGTVLQSSTHCALWPMFEENGVSGLKLASLTLHATDFSLDELHIPTLPFGLDQTLHSLLQSLIEKKKPDIISHISDTVSE